MITVNGAIIPLGIQTSNTIHNEGSKFVFSTNDPIILMSFDFQGDVISSVEIKLNYLAVGYRALQECILIQEKLVSDLRCQNASLDQAVADRDGQIKSLNQAVADRDGQNASLDQAVVERDGQIEGLVRSTSWLLTAPLRFVGRHYKTAKRHLLDGRGN